MGTSRTSLIEDRSITVLFIIIMMLRNIFFFVTTILCVFVLNINKVHAGSANETSDPIVLRSGVILRQFNDTVQRAAAQTSIQDCLCQCHWQTFRDRYGRTHGNCKSTDQTNARWCYVRTPVKTYLGNHGHSTCSDLQRSGRYPGMTWSYQACATPYLTSDVCSYLLQSYYSNNNNGNYRNPIKPRIGESQVEGVFKDPQDGKIKKGNKWLKFPSTISLTDFIKKPTLAKNEDNKSDGTGLSSQEKTKDSTKTIATTPSNQKTEDAVVFG